MKSNKKSNYLNKKLKIRPDYLFYLFSYFPISKAEVDSDLNRIMNLNKLKRTILPSAFKIVGNQIVQGPRIGMYYSRNLNFTKLQYLYNIKATTFKLKEKWYIYDLLLDLKSYKTPLDLCISLDLSFKKKFIIFFHFFKNS